MIKLIIVNEIKQMLSTPKFYFSFLAVSALTLLSVYLGAVQYNESMDRYDSYNALTKQELREQTDYGALANKIMRKPEAMSIFVSGASLDIGKVTAIAPRHSVDLQRSFYSDSPIFAYFRFIDFAFIVSVVFSLFAILFSYDSISGEKEKGVARLIFSNSVPRKIFIVGKIFGIWLGITFAVFVPILLSLLLTIVMGVPLGAGDWLSIAALIGLSILLYAFFITLSVFISAFNSNSSVSFLYALTVWIVLTFIIPRAGVMTAAGYLNIPSSAEIEAKKSAYEKQRWEKYLTESTKRWEERNKKFNATKKREDESPGEELTWQWMEQDEAERKKVENDIEDHNAKLIERQKNLLAGREKLGFLLARFSPVSAYQLAAMDLSATDAAMKSRYEDALREYREKFTAYTEKKKEETGDIGGMRIMIDSNAGVKIETSRDKGSIDLSEMPQFSSPKRNVQAGLISAALNGGWIMLLSVIFAVGALWKFLRYDLR